MGDNTSVHEQANAGHEESSVAGTQLVKKEDLQYNKHLEDLIAAEAEKSSVYRWLHDQAEKRYSNFNTVIAFPVIVISTLAGTASIGSETLFGNSSSAPIIIGLMSLAVSILNVVGNYFAWAKRTEAHRISSINYSKIHRWISIELALPRDQRIPAKHFLKQIREQVDRLNETSPPIPQVVVDKFKVSFTKIGKNISVPEICNDIQNVEIYRGKNIEEETPTMIDNPMLKVIVEEKEEESENEDKKSVVSVKKGSSRK
jgi:hypothetical protein